MEDDSPGDDFFSLFRIEQPPCSLPWCGSVSQQFYVHCLAGHGIEQDCFSGYLSAQLEQQQSLVICCPLEGCCAPMHSGDLRAVMSPAQAATLARLNIRRALGERCTECPACGDIAWIADECFPLRGGQVVRCAACRINFCTGCSAKHISSWPASANCNQCSGELAHARKAITAALLDAHSVACPSCGHRWVKNLACTHMHCTACSTDFCYVCGQSLADLQLAEPSIQRLFDHNIGYPGKPGTCPMWLEGLRTLYAEGASARTASRRVAYLRARSALGKEPPLESALDLVCPSDPELALEWFHIQRGIKALNQVKQSLGQMKWESVQTLWPDLLGSIAWAKPLIRWK